MQEQSTQRHSDRRKFIERRREQRRTNERRVVDTVVPKERRSGTDRRMSHRRSGIDRRTGTERREGGSPHRLTPIPYSHVGGDILRQQIAQGLSVLTCPDCGGVVRLGPRIVRWNQAVQEARCVDCGKGVVATSPS